MEKIIEADVALVGVGFGGFAALRALLERGLTVVAVEEYPWIGGQVTSQALCVLDEFHDPLSEQGIGYSRRYSEFREWLRSYYTENFKLSELGASQLFFNPGNCMNSTMVAEPSVAHAVLQRWIAPYIASGKLKLYTGWIAETVQRSDRHVESVTCRPVQGGNERLRLVASFFLDGTEAGDLYPLTPIGFRLGSDGAQFGERHADMEANPACIQSSTVCFAVEYVPGGHFTIPRPPDYEQWVQSHGPFFASTPGASLEEPAMMFSRRLGKRGRMIPPAFYYRSVVDTRNFNDPRCRHSRTIINACNDYHGEPLVGVPDPHAAYERAKALSRAYLYWIQTEAPRDEGGFGYPEMRLCSEITGTDDGYAMAPYIREGRRLCAHQTIVEEDIATHTCRGSRARHFEDSVGLGGFVIDIHKRCGGAALFSGGVTTKPYQVPHAAMVSPLLENFAVAGKCIGTSQIANGAYRLHNIEWAIGEAAGELAAYCLQEKRKEAHLEGRELFAYQRRLIRSGIPVFWYDDLGFDQPSFEAMQLLSVRRLLPASVLHLRSDYQYSVARSLPVIEGLFENLDRLGVSTVPLEELVLTAHGTRRSDVAHRVMRWLDARGWPEKMFTGKWTPVMLQERTAESVIPEALA